MIDLDRGKERINKLREISNKSSSLFMKELYVVKIKYLLHMKFAAKELGCDVKLFSSKEKAEEFLIKNGFVYGISYFFNEPGWYHINCIKPSLFDINRLVSASIDKIKIDEGKNCECKYNDFILGIGEKVDLNE